MKKVIAVLLFVGMVVGLMACNNNGGDAPKTQWTPPVWAASITTTNPVAAYGENGDLVGYVIGTDMTQGTLTIYNPEMDKFFEMTTSGNIRGWRLMNRIFADDQCNKYSYSRFAKFIFADDHPDYPQVLGTSQFITISEDETQGVLLDNLTQRCSSDGSRKPDYSTPAAFYCGDIIQYWDRPFLGLEPDGVTEIWGDWEPVYNQIGLEPDGVTPIYQTTELTQWDREYWGHHWPDYKFHPVIEYTEAFPFAYPAGKLVFGVEKQLVEEGQ